MTGIWWKAPLSFIIGGIVAGFLVTIVSEWWML